MVDTTAYLAQIWQSYKGCAQMPFNAVRGGHDCDGSSIYVGRAKHEGHLLPTKVVPSKGCAYVCNGGKEYSKTHFEVLVGHGYNWVSGHSGSVPPNAVACGNSERGEPLYIGRGTHSNSLCIGKVHRTHGCLYIPFGGSEVSLASYEVLVYQGDNWVQTKSCKVIPGAVIAGHRAADNAPIYVARALHNNLMVPGKFVPSKSGGYVGFGGLEHPKKVCDLLCGDGYHWVSQHNHSIPGNAVPTDSTACYGEPLYIGRAHYEGSLTPGVISQSQRCALIPYHGREIPIPHYEILCRY